MSTLNDEYLKSLARELRLRSVSESDINQEMLRVMESDGAGVNLRNEFGAGQVRLSGDLTPIWWTPDIQPSRAGKKGNLPPCPGTEN
ncbi:hypothetical protein, partial [Corynebacterium sp. KPL2680]|uniref:hypothetical protein n=1 Tax=Corynebacterium sp. KPL2680 TaxID=3158310 RepID=UPI0032EAA66B